jgi:hypothetical protein
MNSISTRMCRLASFALLLTGSAWAATDGMVGKWKLNPSKSTLTDQMKVEGAGGNKYVFDFGGGTAEPIVADGTDQPASYDSTLAITIEGPRAWKVVRKRAGHLQISATWTLSEDGNTLTDHYTGYRADGSTSSLDYVYKRTAGTAGFAGTWESVSEQVNSVYELEIRPADGDGLTFVTPAQKMTKNVKFDGKDYPNDGPNLPQGFVSSGRRIDAATVELTDKIQGKTIDTQQIKLASDGKSLTMTVLPVGHTKPDILVFERE